MVSSSPRTGRGLGKTAGGRGKMGLGGKLSSAGLGGKGLGKGIAGKRHRKILKDSIHGISLFPPCFCLFGKGVFV
jgi:hypothetical protein